VAKPLKYWNGSAWVEKPVKYWNGSAWVLKSAAATGVFTDNFNRANGNLEGSTASGGFVWLHDGAIAGAAAVDANQLRGVTSVGTGSVYWKTLSSLDQYVQFTPVTVALDVGSFFTVRMTDKQNFVGFRARNGVIQVYRYVAAAGTLLWSGGAPAIGDVLRLEVRGDNFSVYKNGVEVKASTPIGATLTGMNAGIQARSTAGVMGDNFECGVLPSV
jgi:hypothetical protein